MRQFGSIAKGGIRQRENTEGGEWTTAPLQNGH